MNKVMVLLCIFLLGSVLAINIPVIVKIMNTPPEILNVTEPDFLDYGDSNIQAFIRDNNTLDDLCSVFILDHSNGTTTQNLSRGIGEYTFTVSVSSGNVFDYSLYVSDENETVIHNGSVPINTYMSISITHFPRDFSLYPGECKSSFIGIHVESNVKVRLLSSSNCSYITMEGVKLDNSPQNVASYIPGKYTDVLDFNVCIPNPEIDKEQNIQVYLNMVEVD